MRGVFHVHVMKTGGTSLGRVLRRELPGAGYPDPARGDGPAVKVGAKRVLELDGEQRAGIGWYTLHVPAWVAHAVAPDHLRITVLRDPVERTISHLRHLARSADPPGDPVEYYADDRWRRRLADLQTRIFADTPEHYARRGQNAGAASDSMPRAARRRAFQVMGQTGAPDGRELDDTDLPRALEMLETFDVVGVTDDVAGFIHRVGAELDLDLPGPANVNRSARHDVIPASLREQIVEDTQRDTVLYRRACELAGWKSERP